MSLAVHQPRCTGLLHSRASLPRPARVEARAFRAQAVRQPPSIGRLIGRRGLHLARAAADTTEAVEFVLPAEEVLQTLKITQRGDGMFIIEDVIEGSTADKQQIKKGSVLTAVSDPAAPTSLWDLEARSSLRHVLDQLRMQQSTKVKLAIRPPSAADEPMAGRKGLNRDGPVMDERTLERRQQQREDFLDRPPANKPTNWALVGVAVVLVPAALILWLAVSTGFLDETNAGWRSGF